jgi:hypothetical protein
MAHHEVRHRVTTEELLRWIVILVVAASLLSGIIGGLATPIAGTWKDGERLIVLRQLAWLVRGRCDRVGGHEIYRGTACFGRVRLKRTAFGQAYLKSLGFEPELAVVLGGEPLAVFDFRRHSRALSGSFEGRKFSFAREPAAILSVTRLPKEERRWERVA